MIQSVAEAKRFIHWEENEYPGDVFMAKLFEYKTFFITKTPLRKTFLAKITKLNKIVEAYHFLLHDTIVKTEQLQQIEVKYSKNWFDDFNRLQQARMNFKQMVFRSNKADEISHTIENWLTLEESYQQIYGSIIEKLPQENILASVEPDPMELFKVLTEANAKQALSVIYLKNNIELLPKMLINELKRLNLLRNLQ